jgi:hypothetical protein
VNLDTELQRKVQDFLDRVAAHLGAMPDDEKRELLADLESHIHEALEARLSGRTPTLQDLDAVLAEMDPPESYGEPVAADKPAVPGDQTATSARTGLGIVALCISLGSLVVAMLLATLAYILALGTGGLLAWIPVFLFLAGQLTALVLGILSWSSPFGKAAVITSSALMVLTLLFAS